MKARVTDKETVMAEQDTQYYVAARYPSKQTAGKAYTSIERLIYEADCDLSAYRYFVRSERFWSVVIVGEVPPTALHERFITILKTLTRGELVDTLDADTLRLLRTRREQQKQLGPWVERHFDDAGL
jgi:hypothetical protein